MLETKVRDRTLPRDLLIEDLMGFLGQNFIQKIHKDFLGQVTDSLEQHPHRGQNPDYTNFYKRLLLMVAQYGFQEAGAHTAKFGTRGDSFHPLTLLALGTYLGNINVQAAEQKKKVFEYFAEQGREVTHEEAALITAQWILPDGGVVNLPVAEDFLKPREQPMCESKGTRLTRGLPLYLPDTSFDQKYADLGFSRQEAENITFEDFSEHRLPQVAALLGESTANSVFLNPLEWVAE